MSMLCDRDGVYVSDVRCCPEWFICKSRPRMVEADVAASAMANASMPEWIVDTGAAYHLQQTDTAEHVRTAFNPRRVRSASGSFTMDKEALADIPTLGEVGQGVVTSLWDSTPNALPVGRLVVKDGCGFHWVLVIFGLNCVWN